MTFEKASWAVGLNFVIGVLVMIAIDDDERTVWRWLMRCPYFLLFVLVMECWPLLVPAILVKRLVDETHGE
jgi:hypothetical protein